LLAAADLVGPAFKTLYWADLTRCRGFLTNP